MASWEQKVEERKWGGTETPLTDMKRSVRDFSRALKKTESALHRAQKDKD